MSKSPWFSPVFVLAMLLVLSACASRTSAPVADIDQSPRYVDSGRTHRVNGGETLYVVAWMYDLDVNALARANNLREPYNIEPGQILSVDLRGASGTSSRAIAAAPAAAAAAGNAVVTAAAVATGISRAPLDAAPLARQSLPSTPLPDNNRPAAVPPPATPGSEPAPLSPPPAVARTDTAPLPQRELPPPTSTLPAAGTNPAPATVAGATVAGATSTAPGVSPAPPSSTMPAPATSTQIPATPSTITPPAVATTPAPAVVAPAAPVDEPAAAAVANGDIVWAWPARGNLIGRYSDTDPDNKGIKLAGNAGDAVLAAADGEVVYTGNGLLRYGELVILKHNDHFLSAYAHNKVINVKEGDRVRRGTKIAELGSTGIDRDMLHFEIRLDGKPIDPLTYLPPR